ncbi:hypothetical protein FACS189496_3420 [Bacilli bacterium]|nr:hypothetical protein FACS189496_3420 [Bacilli bacterium]
MYKQLFMVGKLKLHFSNFEAILSVDEVVQGYKNLPVSVEIPVYKNLATFSSTHLVFHLKHNLLTISQADENFASFHSKSPNFSV